VTALGPEPASGAAKTAATAVELDAAMRMTTAVTALTGAVVGGAEEGDPLPCRPRDE